MLPVWLFRTSSGAIAVQLEPQLSHYFIAFAPVFGRREPDCDNYMNFLFTHLYEYDQLGVISAFYFLLYHNRLMHPPPPFQRNVASPAALLWFFFSRAHSGISPPCWKMNMQLLHCAFWRMQSNRPTCTHTSWNALEYGGGVRRETPKCNKIITISVHSACTFLFEYFHEKCVTNGIFKAPPAPVVCERVEQTIATVTGAVETYMKNEMRVSCNIIKWVRAASWYVTLTCG